jgi:hypothetical protein
MRQALTVALVTLAGFCVPRPTQGQTAKDTIKKVIEANGGEENLTRKRTASFEP